MHLIPKQPKDALKNFTFDDARGKTSPCIGPQPYSLYPKHLKLRVGGKQVKPLSINGLSD